MKSIDSILKQSLTTGPFTFEDILMEEAAMLCKYAPRKDPPKRPNASTSRLTKECKAGRGDAHCILKNFPSDNTPDAWGERNRALLLDEVITPELLRTLDQNFDSRLLANQARTSHIWPVSSNDNGNEEEYRHTLEKILQRVAALAFLFFQIHWRQGENISHVDFDNATASLLAFAVKSEAVSRDTTQTSQIRYDVSLQIPRNLPLKIQKPLQGTAQTAVMIPFDAKAPGIVDYSYTGPLRSTSLGSVRIVHTVDDAMELALEKATKSEQTLTIADLDAFLSMEITETMGDNRQRMKWPLMATSLFAQVCLSIYILFLSSYMHERWHMSLGSPRAQSGHSHCYGISIGCAFESPEPTPRTLSMYPKI